MKQDRNLVCIMALVANTVLSSGCVTAVPTSTAVPTPFMVADCVWDGTGFAWVDTNPNGVHDNDETSLLDVKFLNDETRNQFSNVGDPAVTNAEGMAALGVFLPGCRPAAFEIYREPPPGWVLTTTPRLIASATLTKQRFEFGFYGNQ